MKISCACGCGKLIEERNKYGRKRKMIKGHSHKGGGLTEETKEKLRIKAKERHLKNPDIAKEYGKWLKKMYKEGKLKPYWKGKHLPKKTIKKISETKKRLFAEGKLKPPNLGKTFSAKTRKKMSETAKKKIGNKNNFYGKRHTKKSLMKMRLAQLGKKASKETKMKMSKTRKGRKQPEIRNFKMRLHWCNPEFKKKTLLAQRKAQNLKPNKGEKKIIHLLKENNLPYKFVGNGKVILDGKNPDFINVNGQKKIIEVFGRVFHDPEKTFIKELKYHSTEKGTKEHYARLGFKTLIIWDDELQDMPKVLEKIGGFENG